MTRRRLLLAAAALAACGQAGPARAEPPPVGGEGIRVLAREKSLAEQFLQILNQYARQNTAQYANGIVLYASAKADFDGLISELEQQLDGRQPPDQNASFQAALNQAVEKRVAFTNFVTGSVIPPAPASGNTRGGVIGSFIQVIPDLFKALTEAGMSIWHEYRAGDDMKRKAIREELEKLRWPPFRTA